MSYDFLKDGRALQEFIGQFEQGTLPKLIWTHAAHLTVGSWYCLNLPEDAVVERVRTGIRHYNECVGTANTPDSGYHETLTLFWLKMIEEFLKAKGDGLGKLDAVRAVVAEFGGGGIYSRSTTVLTWWRPGRRAPAGSRRIELFVRQGTRVH